MPISTEDKKDKVMPPWAQVFALLCCIASHAWADQPTPESQAPLNASSSPENAVSDSPKEDKRNFLDKQKIFVTNQFVDLNDALDRVLSERVLSSDKPAKEVLKSDSYLVMNINSRVLENGDNEYKIRLRAKADLPNTKKRWKLIFESDPEEDVSPQDSERSGKIGTRDPTSSNAVAGLEYVKKRGEFDWQPSADIGTRFNFPVDIFTRVKLKKKTTLGSKWLMLTKAEYSHFAREGAKPSARLTFFRGITPDISFSSVTRYKYTARESFNEGFQSLQLNHRWSHHTGLEYKVGAFGNSDGQKTVDAYFVQFTYKRRIYDDWMFLSLVPEITYAGDDDWSANHGITLQLQGIYAE